MHAVKATSNEIATFFRGKSVFITGGTGFLGKVLIWKLLTSCPEVGRINLLIRGKQGVMPGDRLQAMIGSCPVFQSLQKGANPSVLDKLRAVSGDISEENLGLCKKDEEMLAKSVSVMFHSAATIKFNEPMSKALTINVDGTHGMLSLAKKMVFLESFVHVSTAFTHCYMESMDEKVYPGIPALSLDMIKASEGQDTNAILAAWPNTYCFSKAMAEELVHQTRGDLPIAIVRPSIVVAARKEPFPGWVDNYHGVSGFIASIGSGNLRSILMDSSCGVEIIPVDTVINLMLAIAFRTAKDKVNADVPVYHCISGASNPITWGRMHALAKVAMTKYPFEKVLWLPRSTITKSKTVHSIKHFFVSFIPACLIDLLAIMSFRKPFLIKANRHMADSMEVFSYFLNRGWKWTDGRTRGLSATLTDEDRLEFDFDISTMAWKGFMDNYVLGLRRYAMKCKDDTLEECRQRQRVRYTVDVGLRWGLLMLMASEAMYLVFL